MFLLSYGGVFEAAFLSIISFTSFPIVAPAPGSLFGGSKDPASTAAATKREYYTFISPLFSPLHVPPDVHDLVSLDRSIGSA